MLIRRSGVSWRSGDRPALPPQNFPAAIFLGKDELREHKLNENVPFHVHELTQSFTLVDTAIYSNSDTTKSSVHEEKSDSPPPPKGASGHVLDPACSDHMVTSRGQGDPLRILMKNSDNCFTIVCCGREDF